MNDRHGAPPQRGLPPGIAKSSSRNGLATGPPSTSVRRNLFQSQLTRRPTAGSTSSASTSDTLRLDNVDLHLPPPVEAEAYLDIVIRDKNGEIELGDPPTPSGFVDDVDEAAAAQMDATQEGERERLRLTEAVKEWRGEKAGFGRPEELLDAVKASLRQKVAALAEDNWMFEREELPRHQ
ncbi:hypothetical protein OQA88_6210 [Cercophora sp. LCS_1]